MRNIIIAGGGLVNKGAQAMTIISLCELKKRFPEHRIYLLSWNTSEQERQRHSIYNLELLRVPAMKYAKAANNPIKRALFSLVYGSDFRMVDQIYRNTDYFLDISGYAIGSNWAENVYVDYLDCIEFAMKYHIPVYIMPQSFGPLDFAKNIDSRIRRILSKAKLICAREEDGYRGLIEAYGLTNVIRAGDIVLTSTISDYSAALKENLQPQISRIEKNSIALIPNVRIGDAGGCSNANVYYHQVITTALKLDLNVYILYHSTQDIDLCKDLKNAFADDKRVILLDHDHSCIEFNELVKQFRFVVASRFHAIVHALKNGIPCIALGWASKYLEVMKLFSQEQYVFDLRNPLDADQVAQAVAQMTNRWQQESETICTALPELQKENVFDTIKKA